MKFYIITTILISLLFNCTRIIAQFASLEATFKLKDLNGIKVPFQNGIPVPSFEKQKRTIIELNGNWKKQRFSANNDISLANRDSVGYQNLVSTSGNRYLANYDDRSWNNKILPGVENNLNGFEQVPEYYEDGVWYRKHFIIPDSLSEKFAKIIFYSANYIADIWINDNYLGYHEGGYTPFAFNVTPYLKFDSTNVIAVRIDNPPWGSRQDIVPYKLADWFNYTGLIHDIYLEFSSKVSIFRADVIPENLNGSITPKILIFNGGNISENIDIQINVYEADVNTNNIEDEICANLIGNPANISGTVQKNVSIESDSCFLWTPSITINSPNIWSPIEPNLYIMQITLSQMGIVLDELYTQFGIRILALNGSTIELNNAPVFLTGVARHEDHPNYGRSIPQHQIFSDLQIVKNLNSNFLRTAHYPNHPYTYLITDRLGISVMEEIPVWWFDESLPWILQNSLRHIHQQMWREMIFRDFNRPSIIMWSAANECANVINRQAFIDTVSNDLKINYPDGRLVTQSAAADRPGAYDPSQAVCDVAGWTMYFGIFYGNDYYQDTKNFLELIYNSYPDKPIINTEFGYWSGEGGWNLNEQVTVFNETFRALSEKAIMDSAGTLIPNGFLNIIDWWCVFDWYSSQHPTGFQSMGLYKMNRIDSKPVANVLQNSYYPYFQKGGMVNTILNDKDNFNPYKFNLHQNYPNPFNPNTTIEYILEKKSNIKLEVFNNLGEKIKTLVDRIQDSGKYTINFDASELASGSYFITLTSNNIKRSNKMLLLK